MQNKTFCTQTQHTHTHTHAHLHTHILNIQITTYFGYHGNGNVSFNDTLNTFFYGYMVSDVWLRTILIVRKETRCRHIGYSFQLTARILLYAPSHRQDSIYKGLCYTSRGALAGTRNSSMGPLWRIDQTTHRTMSERSYHWATSRFLDTKNNCKLA